MYAVIINNTLHLCSMRDDAEALAGENCHKIYDIDDVRSDVAVEISDVTERIKGLLEKTPSKSISFIPDLSAFDGNDEDDRNEYITEQLMDDGHGIDFYWKDGVSYEGYIVKVELCEDTVSVTGCLNRCGVSYKEQDTFHIWDFTLDQKAEIHSFCKDWLQKNL